MLDCIYRKQNIDSSINKEAELLLSLIKKNKTKQ